MDHLENNRFEKKHVTSIKYYMHKWNTFLLQPISEYGQNISVSGQSLLEWFEIWKTKYT